MRYAGAVTRTKNTCCPSCLCAWRYRTVETLLPNFFRRNTFSPLLSMFSTYAWSLLFHTCFCSTFSSFFTLIYGGIGAGVHVFGVCVCARVYKFIITLLVLLFGFKFYLLVLPVYHQNMQCSSFLPSLPITRPAMCWLISSPIASQL